MTMWGGGPSKSTAPFATEGRGVGPCFICGAPSIDNNVDSSGVDMATTSKLVQAGQVALFHRLVFVPSFVASLNNNVLNDGDPFATCSSCRTIIQTVWDLQVKIDGLVEWGRGAVRGSLQQQPNNNNNNTSTPSTTNDQSKYPY